MSKSRSRKRTKHDFPTTVDYFSTEYKGCVKKKSYSTEYEARVSKEASEDKGQTLRIYRCAFCPGYHLSSKL